MLVHKGGQINNVQLITGVKIAEMSQLQTYYYYFFFIFFFFGGGGGQVWGGGGGSVGWGGVRVDVNGEVKLL